MRKNPGDPLRASTNSSLAVMGLQSDTNARSKDRTLSSPFPENDTPPGAMTWHKVSFDTRVRFHHHNIPASAPGFLSTCSGMIFVQDNRDDRHLPHLTWEYTQAPGQAEPVPPQAVARRSGARTGNMSGPVRPRDVSRCFLERSPGRSGDCQMHPHASLRGFVDLRKDIS